jgi:DNA-binding NtrC family response regulator
LEKFTVTALAVGFPKDCWGKLQRNALDLMSLSHVQSAQDIEERLTEGNPHLVITYHRPEHSALDHLLRSVQEKVPGVKTILAIPHPDTGHWINALDAGFHDVISFPYHREDIRHLAITATVS